MAKSDTCVLLDKISVNNKIVSMRAVVKQVKIRTINKLTREAKSLQVVKPGISALQAEKQKLKRDRLIEELLLIKKVVNDEVSKLALNSTKESLCAERSNPSSSLKNRALSRLASNPLLVKSVEQFREQYPEWKSKLPSLIDNLGVKGKRQKLKTTFSMKVIKKKADSSANTLDEITTICTLSPRHSESEGDGKKVANKITSCKKKEKSERRRATKVEDLSVKEACNEIKKATKFKTQDIIPKKVKKKQRTKPLLIKSNVMKVARFSEVAGETSSEFVAEEAVVPVAKTADPFFVSKDGKTEYLSSVASKEAVEDKVTVSHKYDEMRQMFFNNFGRVPNRKELRTREKQGTHYIEKPFKSTFTAEKDLDRNKTSKKKEHNLSQRKTGVPAELSVEGPVHPSWEAKRKQKEMLSVSAFQGKKIKFDDS